MVANRTGIKWSREETILALDLYLKINFSKIGKDNVEIIRLANLIGRTPSSVAMKICNIASFDPLIKKRNISGLSNASKLDGLIFEEFSKNLEELSYQTYNILKNLYHQKINLPVDFKDWPDGEYRETIVKARLGQEYFRNVILNIYDQRCCITGLDLKEMLVASHIKPWAISNQHTERTNPTNGLCLNVFHDKAFDRGLITFDKSFKMLVSSKLMSAYMDDSTRSWVQKYAGRTIRLPACFKPADEFLEYHRDTVFLG